MLANSGWWSDILVLYHICIISSWATLNDLFSLWNSPSRPSDTGSVLWIPESWWRWGIWVGSGTWACREPSSSTVCLRLEWAAPCRLSGAITVWPLPGTSGRFRQVRQWHYTQMCPNLFVKVTKTLGLRPAAKGDLAGIHTLLQAKLRKFHLSKILSLQEVEHWLLPRENVVDTYVVEVNVYLEQHALSYF